MTKKGGEVWPLTVYLLKPGIKSPNDALNKKSKATYTVHHVTGLGDLALKHAASVQPRWASRLAALVPDAASLRQQSPGAVLFIKAAARLFAVTFGYGRSLLAPEALLHDFGIRTVLNSVNPALIRSLDSRTLDVSPQMSRKQFVEGRPLAAFTLDRMHDLLKGVTGRVKSGVTRFDSGLISGTDSLHCRVLVASATELTTCCVDLLTIYAKKDYQADFDFIDHVRFVRDPSLVKKLDAMLFAKANAASTDFGFAPPRLLSGEELNRLRCSWDKAAGGRRS